MDIVVRGVVAGDVLDGVPGELVSAVVVYRLDRGQTPEGNSLSLGHSRDLIRETGTESVE